MAVSTGTSSNSSRGVPLEAQAYQRAEVASDRFSSFMNSSKPTSGFLQMLSSFQFTHQPSQLLVLGSSKELSRNRWFKALKLLSRRPNSPDSNLPLSG